MTPKEILQEFTNISVNLEIKLRNIENSSIRRLQSQIEWVNETIPPIIIERFKIGSKTTFKAIVNNKSLQELLNSIFFFFTRLKEWLIKHEMLEHLQILTILIKSIKKEIAPTKL